MNAGTGTNRSPSGLWPLAAVIATTIIAVAVSFYCLSSGRFIVFQNLFYFPVILACIYYLKRGFVFSILLALLYLFLVAAHTNDSIIIREALVRVLIFLFIAGVVTFISLRSRRAEEEHQKIRLWREGVNRILGSLLLPVPLDERLRCLTNGVVETFGADFCRIWLIERGDLCDLACMHAGLKEGPHVCLYRDKCLHLKASSGRYTHVDGEAHRRVPFGAYKIGRIASGEDRKFLTNDVQHDPRVHNHEWAKGLGLKAFAGYRLKPPDGETIGVFALFTKFEISPDMDAVLEGLGQAIALAVQKGIVERSLADSENRYRAVVEDQTEVISRFRTDGTLTFVNEVFCRFFAQKRDDLLGTNWQPKAFPDDIPAIERKLEALSPSEPVLVVENRVYDGSGNVHWMQFINRGLFDERGCLIEIQSVGRDITDRRRIEQRLSREVELKDFLIGLYKTAPAMTDKELYDHVLDYVVRMTDSAIGFFHLVSDDQKEVILTAWNAEALNNCTASYATHYPIEQAGNWVDCVRLRGPVVYNDFPCSPNQKGLPEGHTPVRRFMSVPVVEQDKVRMIFGVGNKDEEYSEFDALDIQVVANDLQRIIAQRTSENRFRRLLKYAPIPMTLSDSNGSVIYRNDRYLEVIGYTYEDVPTVEEWWRVAYPDRDYREKVNKSWNESVERAIKTGSDIGAFEYNVSCKDGKTRVMIISGVIFNDQSLLVIFTDITERKQAEDEIRKYSHDLTERMKELNCLYSVSEVVRRNEISPAEILQRCAYLIAEAYQYPAITACRITWAGNIYSTGNFRQTAWLQSCPIMVNGMQTGTVEVFYLEERPEEQEGPFLAEERHLLNSIAELLGRSAERKQAEEEREKYVAELQKALSEVKTLSGLLPICSSCKKIRNDEGYWEQIEKYVGERSKAEFSHGICPECEKKLYPELFRKK